MEGYAELHCHSNFSFLDGASDPEELVKVASSLGLSAIAITDHNGLYAVPRFASAARLCGLPTIYGAELTLGGSTPRDKMIDPIGDHVVVLAKGPKGYSSLSKVISAGHMANREKGSFELSYEELASANSGDWVVLTGCRKGPIAKALFEQGPATAKKRLGHLCELFGRDKVFVECWDHADPLDEPRNAEFVQIATSLGVELVATNNVHYATRDSAQLHQVLMAIRSNKPIDEIEGWLPPYPMANLRSPKEQLRRFSRFPTLVQNAHDLGLECAFDLELIAPKLPEYARHGQQLGGESPLEEEMVLTPSKQQLRQRELWWEGSWTANLCTEVHEAHIRHVEVGKLARCSEARHRQRLRCVDATAVEGKLLLLFGEACTGAAGNSSSHRSKVVTDRTGISRGHSTGGDRYRRKGPNVMRARTSSPLVMVATTAANPPLVGLEGE